MWDCFSNENSKGGGVSSGVVRLGFDKYQCVTVLHRIVRR